MQATATTARSPRRITMQALLDAIPAFAIVAHPDGSVEFLNRTVTEACGFAVNQLPRGLTLEALFPAGSATQLLSGRAANPLRSPLHTGDRPVVVAEWTASKVEDAPGLILITGRDLTREAGLEDYIVSNQWFETAAALSGGLAHEFNNTLAAILGLSEIISMRLPPDSPLQPFTAKIGGCIERAKGLVRRFSQFSRKSMGDVDAQPTAMVLSEIAAAILGFLPGNVTLATEIHPDTPWCRVDRHVLEHILLNCVNFFRTHLRNDGGRVVLSSRAAGKPGRTSIHLSGSGQSLVGLHLEPLFTLRLMPSATAYDSGIGLFTARALAERASGRLDLRRDDPRTIAFSLELPTAK
jgi:nitrogen-specific signal transduction histidine kinase